MQTNSNPNERQMSYACPDCVGRGVIVLTTEGRHTTVYRINAKKVQSCMADKCVNVASYSLYSYPDQK